MNYAIVIKHLKPLAGSVRHVGPGNACVKYSDKADRLVASSENNAYATDIIWTAAGESCRMVALPSVRMPMAPQFGVYRVERKPRLH